MKNIINNEGTRFIIVGIINTLLGTTIMFVMYNTLQFNYWVSSFSNYFLTSILSYFLNKLFTFRNKDNSVWQIVKFIANIIVCYIIAYAISKPFVIYLLSKQSREIQDNVAMIFGMVLFTILNFVGQKFFAFSKRA